LQCHGFTEKINGCLKIKDAAQWLFTGLVKATGPEKKKGGNGEPYPREQSSLLKIGLHKNILFMRRS
jgi:hypothetical protein